MCGALDHSFTEDWGLVALSSLSSVHSHSAGAVGASATAGILGLQAER